jgi:hypothetical protein
VFNLRYGSLITGIKMVKAVILRPEGVAMEQIVLAAGTALVGAIATDAWQQVREAITGLWRRVHQHPLDDIGVEVDELRELVLRARAEGDRDAECALEGVWQLKFQKLLLAEPALAVEVHQVLDDVLKPSLSSRDQQRIGTIMMTGSSHDSSTFNQIGVQNRYGQS